MNRALDEIRKDSHLIFLIQLAILKTQINADFKKE